jgi:hypothetical protein
MLMLVLVLEREQLQGAAEAAAGVEREQLQAAGVEREQLQAAAGVEREQLQELCTILTFWTICKDTCHLVITWTTHGVCTTSTWIGKRFN